MTESAGLKYEVRGEVALFTFNRPEIMNPLSEAVWAVIFEGVEQANNDASIGAIVFTGEGRAFNSGGDLANEFLPRLKGDIPWDEQDDYLGGLGFLGDWLTIVRESKPMIAAVNGVAVGGGATFMLPMDVILVSPHAQFIFPFTRLGITPELGSTHYLAARVGFGRASEILLSSRPVDGQEAARIGLADRLVPADELLEDALRLANGLASLPRGSMQRTKKLLTENLFETDHGTIWKRESDALREGFQSAEHREAVDAFIEKRKPDFSKFR